MEIENFEGGKIWIQQPPRENLEQNKEQNCHQTSVLIKIPLIKVFPIFIKTEFPNQESFAEAEKYM